MGNVYYIHFHIGIALYISFDNGYMILEGINKNILIFGSHGILFKRQRIIIA